MLPPDKACGTTRFGRAPGGVVRSYGSDARWSDHRESDEGGLVLHSGGHRGNARGWVAILSDLTDETDETTDGGGCPSWPLEVA